MRNLILTMLVAMAFVLNATAQDRTITGRVTDEKNQPVPSVTITSSDGKNGTISDNDGNYKIVVGPYTNTLTFSSVNFETQRITIRSGKINAHLTAINNTLENVVVTGIRNIRRTDYAGAATRVRPTEILDKPTGSFDQLLQGAAPGLLALTSSGQPGTSATIIIRGSGSIIGGTNPLYIVDGIPVEAGTFQGLNPNDFATLDILKDAAATALYGSRGSSGVVVITTKKGSGGKMKLSYSTQAGIKERPDFSAIPMNTSQLLATQEAYGKIAGGGIAIPGWYYSHANPRYNTLTPAQQATEAATFDSISKINTNWRDYFFRTAPFSNNEISVSGGAGRTRIFSSLGIYKEAGITPRTDMKRISLRNNMDYTDDKLNFSFNTAIAYTKRNFQQSATTNSTQNPFLVTNIATPYAKVFKADGTYATGIGAGFVGPNDLDYTFYDENYSDQVKTDFNINTSYKITNTITAAVTAGADFRETQASTYGSQLAFLRLTSTSLTTKAGFQTEGLTRFLSLDLRPSVNFDKVFGKNKVNVGVYAEEVRELTKGFNETGYGIDPRTPNTPAAITQGNATNQLYAVDGGSKSQNALLSAFTLGSYTFNDKYSVSGSYRYDASSKLPEGNRGTPFYSVGGIWTISKENFLSHSNIINELRIRGSYGTSGNSNNFPFGDFGSVDSYGANGSYAGLPALYSSNIGNPNLTWETVYQTNIGTDFSILKNRIYGSIDVYDRITKDLFVQKKLAAEGGGYQTTVNGAENDLINLNAGKLSNRGVEADLSFEVVRNKNFIWTLNGKVGYNKNRVKSLGGSPSYNAGTSLVTEGKALSSPNEVKWAGVDAATGAPLYYTMDGHLTTVYNAADKVQDYGTSEAPWKGGFSSTMRFKNFDIYTFFTFQQGAVKTDNLEYFTQNPVGFLAGGYNQSASLHFWTHPGDIASTPSPLYPTNFSSKIIHDASFLRLKDITMGYTLPSEMLARLKFISRARFYVEAQNVFIWTKWHGMDPEAGAININLSEYPNPRAFTFGLDVTF